MSVSLEQTPESKKNRGQPVSWAAAFLKQLAKFPVAEHDDYVDTVSQAITALSDMKIFEPPEEKKTEKAEKESKKK